MSENARTPRTDADATRTSAGAAHEKGNAMPEHTPEVVPSFDFSALTPADLAAIVAQAQAQNLLGSLAESVDTAKSEAKSAAIVAICEAQQIVVTARENARAAAAAARKAQSKVASMRDAAALRFGSKSEDGKVRIVLSLDAQRDAHKALGKDMPAYLVAALAKK